MNWIDLLDDNHIDYVTRGPNTKRGEVSVQCPWCGQDDPSHHLGISIDREAWGCHRNPSHRGKGPIRLVQALLGCSQAQARLVVAQYGAADPETLDDALKALEGTSDHYKPVEAPPENLHFPLEFRNIKAHGTSRRFYEYLRHRGFHEPSALIQQHKLKCCSVGRWKDRIIIPIYHDTKLVAWTGRAIQKNLEAPRYLSTSQAIKTTIFNYDELLTGGDTLIVTEGPFDALKVDFYGAKLGARATCVFGTSITIDQISLIRKVSRKFNRTVLLLDKDAVEVSFTTMDWLPHATMGTLPVGVSDPGDLLGIEVEQLIKTLT